VCGEKNLLDTSHVFINPNKATEVEGIKDTVTVTTSHNIGTMLIAG
jgi:hypothetical protein